MPRKSSKSESPDITPLDSISDIQDNPLAEPKVNVKPQDKAPDQPNVDPVPEPTQADKPVDNSTPDGKSKDFDNWMDGQGQEEDELWKYDGVDLDELHLDRGRRLRDEVNVNGPGRSNSLVDAVGQIAKGLGYTKGIDANQDVIGRESLKGKVSDGKQNLDFSLEVNRQLDPVRLNILNWDKAGKHKRKEGVDPRSGRRS